MKNIFCIDFGTMRTKAAYFDSKSNKMELFRMGVDEKPYIPSLFYLTADGRQLYGNQAYDHMADDPLGLITKPLKITIREPVVRTGNRQKARPAELIGQLVTGILNQAEGIQNFNVNQLDKLIFTVPVHFAEPDLQVLRKAASFADVKQELIQFVKEPVSAAQAWMQETGEDMDHIIVVDGGGGTLDWACLKKDDDGNIIIVSDPPPGGDNNIGGYNIDLNLFELLQDKVEETNPDLNEFIIKEKVAVLEQIKKLKERYSRSRSLGVIRFHGESFTIDEEEIESVFHQRYVSQFCGQIVPFIKKVQDKLSIEKPKLLLVGGSSLVPGLAKEINYRIACEVVCWDRGVFATVLGNADNGNKDVNIRKITNITSEKIQEFFEAGLKELDVKGDFNEAIDYFTTCIKLNPKMHEAFMQRGRAKLENNDYKSAINDCTNAIKLNPEDDNNYYYRAEAKFNLEDYESAIKDYSEAIKINPENDLFHKSRGVVKFILEDYEGARNDFSNATTLNSDDYNYWLLAEAKAGIEDYEGAINDYTAAIKLNPENDLFYNCRGLAKSELEDFDGAVDDFMSAIKMNPNNDEYYNNRGKANYSLGYYEKAIEDFSTAIKLNPENDLFYNCRGLAKSELEDFNGAVDDFTSAIKMNPDNDEYYNNRGEALVHLLAYEEATKDYSTAIKINPDADMYYNNRGEAKFHLGKYDKAIKDYSTAIKINPDADMYYSNRGVAISKRGRYRSAIKDCTISIEMNPVDMNYFGRGAAKSNLGYYKGAIKDFTAAIKKNPENDLYFYFRGMAKDKLKDYKGAIHDFNTAIKINPYNEAAKEALHGAKFSKGDIGLMDYFFKS